MNAFAGRTALVTGGSRGIGLELAKLCAAEGADVVLVSRSQEALDKAAAAVREAAGGVSVTTIAKDLSEPGAAADLWSEIQTQGVGVDVLINNAGFGMFGRYAELDAERERQMLYLNMNSLAELTRLALKDMLSRGWGRILNVASTAAFQSVPYFTAYAASKSFVLSYTEALAEEVRGTGVSVTCLSPGPTSTDFFAVAEMKPSRQIGMLRPEEVARKAMKALLRGKPLVVTGFFNRLLILSTRFAFRRMVVKAAGKGMATQLPKAK